jgi:hypothetical protein
MEEQNAPETEGPPREPGCFFCETAIPFLETLWPENARGHFRESRIEFLKGIRSLIDDRIAHLSRHEQKGTTIPVE